MGFWLDLGIPRAFQKLKRKRKQLENIDLLTRSFLKEGSGRVLGGSWDGFEVILRGFSMDFAMIF